MEMRMKSSLKNPGSIKTAHPGAAGPMLTFYSPPSTAG
jgi:hypothetical protein